MTKEKAILWLKRIRTRQTGGKTEYDIERKIAIDMAIEALEQYKLKTPCDLCKHWRGDYCNAKKAGMICLAEDPVKQ